MTFLTWQLKMAGKSDQERQLMSGATIGAEVSDPETNDPGDRRRNVGVGQSFDERPKKIGIFKFGNGSLELTEK